MNTNAADEFKDIPVPSMISEIADAAGGTIGKCMSTTHGVAFATMSMPLPKDHWLYETDEDGFSPRPVYPMRAGSGSKARNYLASLIVNHGGKYGVKAATANGREEDFDPDALVRNVEIGLFGVFTENGLTNMGPEDAALFDPIDTSPTLGKTLLEAISLALVDGLMGPCDIHAAMSASGISAAVARYDERLRLKEEELQAWRKRKGLDVVENQAMESSDTNGKNPP